MNLPVADAFEPDEPLLHRLDRPFRAACRAGDDRTLAAVKQLAIARGLVDETDAISRHLMPSLSAKN